MKNSEYKALGFELTHRLDSITKRIVKHSWLNRATKEEILIRKKAPGRKMKYPEGKTLPVSIRLPISIHKEIVGKYGSVQRFIDRYLVVDRQEEKYKEETKEVKQHMKESFLE